MRDIKAQAKELGDRLQKAGYGDDVAKAAKAFDDKLTSVEGQLTQLQGEGGQDALNFPGQLDNQFLVLYGNVEADDVGPSRGMRERFSELTPQLTKLLGSAEAGHRHRAAQVQPARAEQGRRPDHPEGLAHDAHRNADRRGQP